MWQWKKEVVTTAEWVSLKTHSAKCGQSSLHGQSLTKLTGLNVPPVILTWIFSFLTGRLNMAFSCPHPNLSTDVLFKVLALTTCFILLWKVTSKHSPDSNVLFKYADYTNLLVPEFTDVDINDEFNNVPKWAADNRPNGH